MKLLVAYASKHGSTREIAMTLAAELQTAGHDTLVSSAGELETTAGFDAIILGSAIYMGRWMPDAVNLVEKHKSELQNVPVWLFSSGPIGDGTRVPSVDSRKVDWLTSSSHARSHRIFAGRLDCDDLGRMERIVLRAVHAPTGDFRDWKEIRDWAREISAELGVLAVVP